jgi:hypothetical protein
LEVERTDDLAGQPDELTEYLVCDGRLSRSRV